MNISSLLSKGFKDAIIGIVIGLGGFATLFPDVLESIGNITNFGSFFALRVFSIIFFLTIIILVGFYWWWYGMDYYRKKIFDSDIPKPKNKCSISILILFIKLLPIGAFINGIDIGNYLFWIIWYYLAIAIGQLFLTNYLYKDKEILKRLKTNSLIFSLDIALGIGLSAFIEPWIIYKASFFYAIVTSGLIYSIFTFIFYFKKNKQAFNTKDFFNLAFGLILITGAFSVFPSVNYSLYFGIFSLAIITITALILFVFKNKDEKIEKNIFIKILTISVVSLLIVYVYSNILENVNKKYFENRLAASKNISDKKVFPFAVYENKHNNEGVEFKNTFAKYIAENNYLWSYYNKIKTKSDIDSVYEDFYNNIIVKDSISMWKDLSVKYNIRKVFYEKYLKIKEKSDESKNITKNQDSINVFYDSVYTYIDSFVIQKYFSNKKLNNTKYLKDYLHPINYYTKTIKTYKGQLNSAKKIQELNIEIGTYLQMLNLSELNQLSINNRIQTIAEKINNEYKNINELKALKYEINLKTKFDINHADTTYFKYEKFFNQVVQLKSKQYAERFKKAQNIFHVYLKDSQRIGVFVLVYSLLIFLLLFYNIRVDFNNDKKNDSEEKDITSSFVNIMIFILLIVVMYMSRSIKPENINPEEPRWMMNLKNWYSPTIIETSFSAFTQDKEKNKNCNILMQSNETIFKEMNVNLNKINTTLNEKIDSTKEELKDINERLGNHGDFNIKEKK